MSSSHSIAGWLFEHAGIDLALAGDLEECARGRSAVWYWGQVLIAIWIGTWDAILHHKLLGLRAVATGCAVNAVWLLLWRKFIPFLGFPLTPMISIKLLLYFAIILFAQSVTGWVVARTHRTHPFAMTAVFAIWLLAWFVGDAIPYVRGLLVFSNLTGQTGFLHLYLVPLAWYSLPEFPVITGLFIGGIAGARSRSTRRR